MKLTRSQQRTVGRSIVFIIAALILAVICTLVSALSVFLSTRLHGFSFPDTYTMKVGMDSTKPNKLKSHSYKIGTFHDKETVYVNFTILRTYCGFYESGDRQELRFILPADGSYFTVKDGSTQVDINGNLIRSVRRTALAAPCVYRSLCRGNYRRASGGYREGRGYRRRNQDSPRADLHHPLQ